MLWLRNSCAVIVSQAVDVLVVNYLYLAWGLGFPLMEVLHIVVFTYAFKLTMCIAITPLLYGCVAIKNTLWLHR